MALVVLSAFALLIGLALPGTAAVPRATPSPPFTQCPAVGADKSCAVLIIVNADKSLTVLTDSSQPPYGNNNNNPAVNGGKPDVDDTLIGIVNNSGVPLGAITLTSTTTQPPPFAFETDGLCAFPPTPSTLCQNGQTTNTNDNSAGYGGPIGSFTNVSADGTSGTVLFNPQVTNGSSTYFALEGAVDATSLKATYPPQPPPPTPPTLGLTAMTKDGSTPQAGGATTVVLTPSVSGAPESGKLTLTQTFPPGVTITGPPVASQPGTWDCSATMTGSSTLRCTWTPAMPLAPGSTLPTVSVPLSLDKSVPGGTQLANGSQVTDGSSTGQATGIPVKAADNKPANNRVSGPDRLATSIAVSQIRFFAPQSAGAVVLARSDLYADALAGAPFAFTQPAPILLNPPAPAALDSRVLAEIQRILPAGGTVYLLGGPAALSTGIDAALTQAGFNPVRIAGANRYATAVALAGRLGNPTNIIEVNGNDFPDALPSGPAAIVSGAAILETAGSSQSADTSSYLAAHPADNRTAIGGPAAAADPGANGGSVVGTDRYDTSNKVAARFFAHPSLVGAATGTSFPDALAAGPFLGTVGPLMLVPPSGSVSSGTTTYLQGVKSGVTALDVFGGPSAVGSDVQAQMYGALS